MNPSRLQPRFGDKTLGVKVLCPEKEAAVSRGLQQSLGENSTLCCLLCRKSIISERRFETATYQVYMKKKTEKKNKAIMQVLYGIEKLLKSYPRKLGVSMRSRVLDGVCRFLLTPLAPHSHMWGQSTLIIVGCPQNGTGVLRGLITRSRSSRLSIYVREKALFVRACTR